MLEGRLIGKPPRSPQNVRSGAKRRMISLGNNRPRRRVVLTTSTLEK